MSVSLPVLQGIQSELAVVDARIGSLLSEPTLPVPLRHILHPGGKRIRAALAILSAQLGTPDEERMYCGAVGVEFIHVATLAHDDVIDHSPVRRGRPSVWKEFGEATAILVGDYYLTCGLRQINLIGDSDLSARAAAAVMAIIRGEFTPVTADDNVDNIAAYFSKIEAKTAALMRVACRAGAVAGGLSDTQRDAMDEYARQLGIAFQIVDDLRDYISDEDVLGKAPGTDIREGTVTLPLLRALGSSSELQRLLAREPNEATIAEIIERVRTSPAVPEVWRDAHGAANRAKDALSMFDDAPAHTALMALCDFVADANG